MRWTLRVRGTSGDGGPWSVFHGLCFVGVRGTPAARLSDLSDLSDLTELTDLTDWT